MEGVLTEKPPLSNWEREEFTRKLFEAIHEDEPEDLQEILEKGADPNTELDGEYPLHRAALLDNEKMVLLLLEHGADPKVRNRRGEVPLDLASKERVTALLKKALREKRERI